MKQLTSCFCSYFKNVCSAISNRRKYLQQKRRLYILRRL